MQIEKKSVTCNEGLYLTVDGDDVGRKITSFYILNDEKSLQSYSKQLNETANEIGSILVEYGLTIIFCAADGVVAKVEFEVDFGAIFDRIQSLGHKGTTFSAGVGRTLREAYLALLLAKSRGKNNLATYVELDCGCKSMEVENE